MDIRIDWPLRGHSYSEEEIAAAGKIMRLSDSQLTQGNYVKKFEQDLTKYLGVEDVFVTMSCAHALDISAMLIEVEKGDEVIMPSHTYCASALAFARRGATIKWADINPESLTISLESIKKLVTSKTKLVVVVHLYGLLCPEIQEISNFCKNNSIILIEDCAQSLGAKFKDKHCGTFGDIGCYSFHAQKNLTTLGEGGAITVKDKDLSKKVSSLRLNGHADFTNKKEYWLPAMTNVDLTIEGVWPIKSTMNEVQAAVGSIVLSKLDEFTQKRRERGALFRSELAKYPELKFQKIYDSESHSHHLLPARYISKKNSRDDLIKILFEKYGIKAIVQFYPLHRYDLFKKTGLGNASLPETDLFFDNMLSFPFSLTISDKDVDYLIQSIKKALIELRD